MNIVIHPHNPTDKEMELLHLLIDFLAVTEKDTILQFAVKFDPWFREVDPHHYWRLEYKEDTIELYRKKGNEALIVLEQGLPF